MNRTTPMFALLKTLAGPFVWFTHLSLLYGGATIACRNSLDHSGFLIFAAVVTVTAIVILFGYSFMQVRRNADTFLNALSFMLAILSILAVTWTASAALTLGCGN